MATISFDKTFNINTAIIDTTERLFTKYENDIYTIRQSAINEINSDKLFKHYQNSNLNLIPLIDGKSKRVFILTGPQKTNVVIFGNDYLLTFNKKNKLVSKKQLHQNIIHLNYSDDGKMDSIKVESTMHTHSAKTGDLITSTDICTLMLYEKFANWKSHIVVGKHSMSIWTCESNTLGVIPLSVIKKIEEDQKKRHKN